MGITERLYYTDSYLRNFKARVVRADGGTGRIYLDRTAFYPTSGGQAHDTGCLGTGMVLDVIDEGDEIAHIVSEPLQPGTAVECSVDWDRRYDHMQQHTGQHLLSAVWAELFHTETVSVHFGQDTSSIEVTLQDVSPDQIAAVEARANQLCWEARPVHIGSADASASLVLRKPSSRTGTLRVVEIEGIDRSACGGTHVRSTAELAPLQMRNVERIRGRVRIEFVCGGRALRLARKDFELLTNAAKVLTTAVDDLPSTVSTMRERLLDAEKDRSRMTLDLARAQGTALFSQTVPGEDGIRRLRLDEAKIDDAARAKVQAFVSAGRALGLVVAPGALLVACSPDSGIDAGKIVKTSMPRGGGSAAMAQGSVTDPAQVAAVASALGLGNQ